MKNKQDEVLEEEVTFEGESTLESPTENTYPLTEVRIDKGRMSIFDLNRKLNFLSKGQSDRSDIILDPDFQREFRWDKKQKSELIESILMGIPIPVFYFFQNDSGKKQVVDGRQRITSIHQFLENDFALSELRILKEFKDKKFKDLEPIFQNKIEDYQLEIYTILPPTPEGIKLDIFDRINRSGTKLNNQEMRNALHFGVSTTLIKELSEQESFKKATGKIDTKAMKDRYLILRFISFYFLKTGFFKNKLSYSGEINEFLTQSMKLINKCKIEDFRGLERNFDKTMSYISQEYEDTAFRFLSKENNRKRPVNMGLFESVTYAFMLAQEQNITIDKAKFNELKANVDEPKYFTYGIDSKENVDFRFSKFEELLRECK